MFRWLRQLLTGYAQIVPGDTVFFTLHNGIGANGLVTRVYGTSPESLIEITSGGFKHYRSLRHVRKILN